MGCSYKILLQSSANSYNLFSDILITKIGETMSQQVVTIFGGSGFLGRYIVQELAEKGYRIKVATRFPDDSLFLKPSGTVGQIAPIFADIRDADSINKAIKGSDIVINAIGILYEKGKQRFAKVHAQGAEAIAKAAKKEGVTKLIHISALGVDQPSKSKYARTKHDGEKAVLKAFKDATILRPSVVFGPEDNFFNMFASLARFLPALPLIGGGKTKFQPVYAGDIAKAVVAAIKNDKAQGKTYELGGPEILDFKEIMQYVLRETKQCRFLVPLPFSVASLEAFFLEFFPKPLLTRDQVKLLKVDNVVSKKAKGFKDLGIEPTALDAIVPEYLERYQ